MLPPQTYTYTIKPIPAAAAAARRPAAAAAAAAAARGAGGDADQPVASGLGAAGDAAAGAAGAGAAGAAAGDASSDAAAAADAGVHGFEVSLVLEYAEMGSLREALDNGAFRLDSGGGAGAGGVNLPAVLDTAIDVARAMLHLHSQSILHADLKARK